MVGVGWLEKWGIKLSHLSTEVEVEVEDELGKNNFLFRADNATSTTRRRRRDVYADEKLPVLAPLDTSI